VMVAKGRHPLFLAVFEGVLQARGPTHKARHSGPHSSGASRRGRPGGGAPQAAHGRLLTRLRTHVRKALATNLREHPKAYYINVHNRPFPDGAIRGQLERN
jgi:hypothetical protein